jgi:DNA polymerase I-like protein with 3'-5' exonuclease and polymerase domains
MLKLYLDIETTVTPHPEREGILLVGYALGDKPVTVLDWFDFNTEHASSLETGLFLEMLADPSIGIVEQTKYDARYLALAGLTVAGPIFDTTVMAWVMNENTPLDIDWLAWRYAGLEMDKRLHRSAGRVLFTDDDGNDHDLTDWREWSNLFEVDEHGIPNRPSKAWLQFIDYNRRDVNGLRRLEHSLEARLAESEWLSYYEAEMVPYTGVLQRMETRGLPVNEAATVALAQELAPQADALAAELIAEGGLPPSFNINSGDQLAAYLFSRVVTFNDVLVYDTETIQCLKSCLDGEHEDCIVDGQDSMTETTLRWQVGGWAHIIDLLPEGFTLDKLGRDRVHGHWTVKGRGLKPTPPPRDKVTGKVGKRPSTASPELLYMHAGDPWVKKLCLEYRKLNTLLTTFLTRWPEQAHEGRLYGRFNQTGTVTGRLSSSGPNLQNVPARGERGKQIRGLFSAKPGTLLAVGDYDQLEMRLMAHFSQDAHMMRVFREGGDPHLITAQGIFGDGIDPDGDERGIGKTLNFAMGYGAGPKKVAQVLSLAGYPTTKEVAAGYLAEMSRFYRGFFRWKQEVMAKAKRKGNVRTIGGQRRRLRSAFKDTANWKMVGYGERQAVNAIIQGSAADIIRRVMVSLDAETPELRLLAQVHDELVFEVDEYGVWSHELAQRVKKVAEVGHGYDLRVPLLFDPHAAETWAAAKAGDELDLDLVELLEEE